MPSSLKYCHRRKLNSTSGPPVLSPDGGAVAFSATDASGKNMLWIRSFDSLTAQPLAGTEGGASPFWSANGRALGFFSDGKLKTIELSGGPAIVVADAPVNRGGSWNRQGTLLFVPDTTKGLYQVAASGGTPVPVLELDTSKYSFYVMAEISARWKAFPLLGCRLLILRPEGLILPLGRKRKSTPAKGERSARHLCLGLFALPSRQGTDGAGFRSGAGATQGRCSPRRATGRFGFLW